LLFLIPLVVDDEAAIRTVATRMLDRLGFAARTAPDGTTALAVVQLHNADLVCVILDILMPHMDGLTTALAIHQVALLPIILMSGYAPQTSAHTPTAAIAGFLPKPFTLADLRAVLNQVIRTLEP